MEKRRLSPKVQGVLALALLLLAVFGGAGRWDWVRGWIFVAEYVGGMGLALVVLRRVNPGLIEARSNWRHTNTKGFDRIILAIYLPMTYVQPALAGIEVVRLDRPGMPEAALYGGVLAFAAAIVLMGWVMAVNPFAEPTVRIQTEREHRVIRAGPYRFVRHPMYVGAILMHVAVALILGSYWALAAVGVIAVLLVLRTALEDRTLQRELSGYREFAAQTRWRLVPGIW